jgi:hypothetical protein
VFNENWLCVAHRLTYALPPEIGISMHNFPHSIINGLCVHTHFLVTTESGKELGTHLNAMQVHFLAGNVWI